jgi:hypothetical protein
VDDILVYLLTGCVFCEIWSDLLITCGGYRGDREDVDVEGL